MERVCRLQVMTEVSAQQSILRTGSWIKPGLCLPAQGSASFSTPSPLPFFGDRIKCQIPNLWGLSWQLHCKLFAMQICPPKLYSSLQRFTFVYMQYIICLIFINDFPQENIKCQKGIRFCLFCSIASLSEQMPNT